MAPWGTSPSPPPSPGSPFPCKGSAVVFRPSSAAVLAPSRAGPTPCLSPVPTQWKGEARPSPSGDLVARGLVPRRGCSGSGAVFEPSKNAVQGRSRCGPVCCPSGIQSPSKDANQHPTPKLVARGLVPRGGGLRAAAGNQSCSTACRAPNYCLRPPREPRSPASPLRRPFGSPAT